MGGAVSSGCDNNELIDNLMGGNFIRTRKVERVFRVLDRADYMTPESRDQAYKDLAWRYGPLHMSAPCIYSEVMEGLDLKPGLTFLNVGSGTGYLSTLVGLIIGSSGISHGVEVNSHVVEYSTKKLSQFLENSPTLDEFDFCEPRFYTGNGLCIAPLQTPYDRVYCGAGCPDEYQNYFKQLIKVGGVLVMPLNDMLLQIRRISDTEWTSRSLLNVSFATLRVPDAADAKDPIKLDEQTPVRLQVLARAAIRSAMRAGLMRRHPKLREPPPPRAKLPKACPRRICIPVDDDSDVEGLNALHDLDPSTGANEMNALLSLVLSMGQNRVAGALRFDQASSGGSSSNSEPDSDAPDNADDRERQGCNRSGGRVRERGNMLTLQLRSMAGDAAGDARPQPGTSRTPPPRAPPREPWTPRRLSQDHDSDSPDVPKVPAEVEIYLGKSSRAGPSDLRLELDTKREHSSDDDTASGKEETKRQKFDSGLGEENTPSTSSPAKTEDTDDGWCSTDDELMTPADDVDENGEDGAKRRKKRDSSQASGTPARPRRRRVRRRPRPRGPDARRVDLSIHMKRGVKELPLPYQLKKYVNLGRCFEF